MGRTCCSPVVKFNTSAIVFDCGPISCFLADIHLLCFQKAVDGLHTPEEVGDEVGEVRVVLDQSEKVFVLVEPGEDFEKAKTETQNIGLGSVN